jgi:hypothetical protein
MDKKREMRYEDARDIRATLLHVRRIYRGLVNDDVQDYRVWESVFYSILTTLRVLEKATTKEYRAGITEESIFWCEGCGGINMTEWKLGLKAFDGSSMKESVCKKCGGKK